MLGNILLSWKPGTLDNHSEKTINYVFCPFKIIKFLHKQMLHEPLES